LTFRFCVLIYNLHNLCIYIPFPIRWLICMLRVFSALSPLRSITRRTEQNGLTSDKCLLSSSKSSFSAIELIHANTYVDESCNIPWRGYLLASSQRSCEQAPMLDNKSYIFGKVNYNYFHSTGSILTSWYLFI